MLPAEKNSPHRLRYAALCGDFFVSAGGFMLYLKLVL